MVIRPNPIKASIFLKDEDTPLICCLSLHDALPIYSTAAAVVVSLGAGGPGIGRRAARPPRTKNRGICRARDDARSEEHTSELQSHSDLVCRLLHEKKKYPKQIRANTISYTVSQEII